ncbi:MAG: C40 family peptidase [Bacteroidetes bacterium]|nr:C40 family peptidase [Bacteroidota bacterium]
MKLTHIPVRVLLLLPIVAILVQSCSSLEPLPRFRTSSTSFAPDQLPIAERSSRDLIDPTTVASYSIIKEQATRQELPETEEDVERLIVNQSLASTNRFVDKVGLDIEEIEDELAEGDDADMEEVPAFESAVDKVLEQTLAGALDEATEINAAVNRPELMREIINLLGIRYRYGGTDATRGLDCSAFTGTIYSRALGIRLPRSSNQQFREGATIKRTELKIGDLVFFKTRRRHAPVSHVGIYIGHNLFAHASTKYGVVISSLEHPYYNRTYVGARRLLETEVSEAQASR